MDGMDKNGLLNGQWTMDNGQGQGQEWTRTAGDIFLCLSIRPLNVKSIASVLSMMSIRVPIH